MKTFYSLQVSHCLSDHHEGTLADAEEDASVSERAQQGRS